MCLIASKKCWEGRFVTCPIAFAVIAVIAIFANFSFYRQCGGLFLFLIFSKGNYDELFFCRKLQISSFFSLSFKTFCYICSVNWDAERIVVFVIANNT